MQCACAMLLSVACAALLYFSTLFHGGTTFGGKVIAREMCFDFLYNFYLKYFSLPEELSEI
jgi:hypothetical protein